MHAVLVRVPHDAVVERPVVGRVGRVRRVGRSARRDAVTGAPVEVQPHFLHVQLLQHGHRRVDRPVERLRLVVDTDPQVARGMRRLCGRSNQRRRHERDGDSQANCGHASTGSRPSAVSQRPRPSSRSTSGDQPRIWRARVMSGRRICGSSIGSASNTISLRRAADANHRLRELEHRHLVIGVAEVHGQMLIAHHQGSRGRGSGRRRNRATASANRRRRRSAACRRSPG